LFPKYAPISRRSLLQQAAGAILASVLVAGCGSSAPAPAATSSTASTPSAASSPPNSSPTAAPASAASPTGSTVSPAASPTAAAPAQAQPSGQAAQVRFIAMDYDDRMEADTKQLMDKFNQSQSSVHADVQVVKWSDGQTVLLTQINAGKPPDIANYSGGGLLQFAAANVLEPLDGHLGADFLANFVKAALDAMRVGGKLMGMPYFLDPRGLFYRTDLFDQAGLKPPQTWDDLIQAAQKLNKPPSVYGDGIGVTGPSGGGDYWWYAWIGAIGAGSDLARWGPDKRSLAASDHGIQAVQYLVDLNRKYKVTQPSPVNAGRDEDLQPLFLSGKLAMLETGSWFPTILQHDAPKIAFDVVPIPVATSGMQQANVFWPDAVMMFNGSKQKDAATQLLEFMFNKQNRLDFAKQRGVVPERTDVGSDPRYAVTKFDKFFFQQLEHAYNVFQTPWPATGTADDKTIQAGVAKALLGEKSVKDAMQEAASTIDASHHL
jgi:ABC-type glycerol-3-phosphate transport system substrate-binding protein